MTSPQQVDPTPSQGSRDRDLEFVLQNARPSLRSKGQPHFSLTEAQATITRRVSNFHPLALSTPPLHGQESCEHAYSVQEIVFSNSRTWLHA